MIEDIEGGSDPATLRRNAGQIRHGVNWQGTAIKGQYERLAANMHIDPEAPVIESVRSHYQAIADLDFLITSVRRLLRIAEQARSYHLDPNKELKLAIKIFNSRWHPSLVNIRNALEHVDKPGTPFFPARFTGPASAAGPGTVHGPVPTWSATGR